MKRSFLFIVTISLLAGSVASQVTCIDSLIQGQGGVQGIYNPICQVYDTTNQYFLVCGNNYLTMLKSESLNSFQTAYTIQSNATINLGNASSLVLAKDGRFCYVKADDEIVVFGINTEPPLIEKIQSFKSFDTLGYSFTHNLSMSADGKSLYCINDMFADIISVFDVDTISGHISLAHIVKNGVDGIQNLNGLNFITCSRDDDYLYVSVFSEVDSTVQIFKRDKENNDLDWIQTLDSGDSIFVPSLITESADGKYVYVYDYNCLLQFERDSETGLLTLVEKTPPFTEIPGFSFVFSMTMGNNDSNIYLAGDHMVIIFSRHADTGKLELSGCYNDENIFSDIWDIKCIQNESLLCVVSFSNSSLVFLNIDPLSGSLSFNTQVYNGCMVISGLDTGFKIIPSDNKYFYILSNANTSYLESFRINNEGKLTYLGMLSNDDVIEALPYRMPSCAVITPDHSYIYVGSAYYDLAITTIQIDGDNGRLLPKYFLNEDSLGINSEVGYTSLVCSHDGKFLYGAADSSIYCYSINTLNGKLSLVSTYNVVSNGSNGLRSIIEIRISLDNKNLYAVSGSAFSQYGFSVYGRNQETGAITFVETEENDDLLTSQPSSFLISGDGMNLYAFGSSINSFDRIASTGKLFLTNTYNSEYYSDGIPAINYLRCASISHDGMYVSALSPGGPAIINLHRSTESGLLFLDNAYLSKTPGIGRLSEVSSIAYIPETNYFMVLSAGKLSSFINDASGTALPELISDDDFIIYPNPATQCIYIHSKNSKDINLHIQVFDNTGRCVIMGTDSYAEENDIYIPVNNLEHGVYFLSIETAKSITLKKFIKL
jgi:6-phosphogluconolactonase (cycloisomerase 2 family)